MRQWPLFSLSYYKPHKEGFAKTSDSEQRQQGPNLDFRLCLEKNKTRKARIAVCSTKDINRRSSLLTLCTTDQNLPMPACSTQARRQSWDHHHAVLHWPPAAWCISTSPAKRQHSQAKGTKSLPCTLTVAGGPQKGQPWLGKWSESEQCQPVPAAARGLSWQKVQGGQGSHRIVPAEPSRALSSMAALR